MLHFYSKRRRVANRILDDNVAVKMGTILNQHVQDDADEDRYIRVGGLMVPSTDGKTYISSEAPGSPTTPSNPYTAYFDDPVYDTAVKPKRPSTKRTESRENLLEAAGIEDSGDYDMPLPPERTTSLKDSQR